MHKLIEYICDELEELERKAEKGGKLSMQEVQYGDMLAHFKKNLLKSDEMMEEARGVALSMIDNCLGKGQTDWNRIKAAVRDSLSDYFWKKTKRRPMILPIIMEV